MTLLQEMVLEEGLAQELNVDFHDVAGDFGELDKLEPAISARNVNFHLNTLTKGYFEKVEKTGSPFAYCGAKLHSVWWEQFNGDGGDQDATIKALGYQDMEGLIAEVQAQAKTIQGNGWVVVTREVVTTCPNHSWSEFDDIVLLVDMWEHAYQVDYDADKDEYIKQLLSQISWDVISSRM